MTSWYGSFCGRLVLAVSLLLGVLGAFFIALAVMSTRLHLQTVEQSLNQALAANIVADRWLPLREGVSSGDFSNVFDRLMNINPSTEIYLLDPAGSILAYSAPPDRVRLKSVSMAPIAAFLREQPELPIYGDDPRDPGVQRVFSVAGIDVDGRREGYLYVVLGGEAYRSIAKMFEGSYVLRLSIWLGVGGIVLTVVVGVFVFRVLCRRLGALSQAMAQFEHSDFRAVPASGWPVRSKQGDEIDQLARMFQSMSGRIAEQIVTLEQLDASRRELVMHISHDLRTPLASLQGYLDTLAMKWDALSAEVRRDYLDAALGISQRLRGMIGDLFELATLEVYTSPLRPETFAMEELAQDVCQKYAPKAHEKGIELQASFSEARSHLFADIGLIERALANLLDNALKFTPRGGKVRVTVEGDGPQVTARVVDSGIGIAAERLDDIFDRFYRVDTSEEGRQGSGLGLAIVKRIVELHGGTISVESTPGKGAVFSLVLPKVP